MQIRHIELGRSNAVGGAELLEPKALLGASFFLAFFCASSVAAVFTFILIGFGGEDC